MVLLDVLLRYASGCDDPSDEATVASLSSSRMRVGIQKSLHDEGENMFPSAVESVHCESGTQRRWPYHVRAGEGDGRSDDRIPMIKATLSRRGGRLDRAARPTSRGCRRRPQPNSFAEDLGMFFSSASRWKLSIPNQPQIGKSESIRQRDRSDDVIGDGRRTS